MTVDYRPAGSTRNWAEPTRKVAEEIERRFGVKCSTYPGHGRTGEQWGIDVWVAPFRQKANAKQEELGDLIQLYVERNWARLGIDYIIWWNWMKESSGTNWFSYEPYAFSWKGGDADADTRRHLDHLHLQIIKGHVYRPPPAGSNPMKFAPVHLQRIMPNLGLEGARAYFPYLVAALNEFQVNTRNRIAYFLGQVAHESGELRYWRELGSDAYLKSKPYYPYIGRGPIMTTWLENYRMTGQRLDLDLVNKPYLLERKEYGFRSSCAFWRGTTNGVDLNLYADNPSTANFNIIMRTVLGTSNHPSWQSRADYTNRAFAVLPKNVTL